MDDGYQLIQQQKASVVVESLGKHGVLPFHAKLYVHKRGTLPRMEPGTKRSRVLARAFETKVPEGLQNNGRSDGVETRKVAW